VEIEDCGGLAGDAAAPDEPFLEVDLRRQPFDKRVQVEHLHVPEINAFPISLEIEGLRIDALRERLHVREPQHQILCGYDDAGRADLAVRQIQVTGCFKPYPGLGVNGDGRAKIKLDRLDRRIGLEALGQVSRILRTHRPQLVGIEAQADVHLRQKELVRTRAPFEKKVERLLRSVAGVVFRWGTEVQLERERSEIEARLADNQGNAVDERQIEHELLP
jgi:hypothetical protein